MRWRPLTWFLLSLLCLVGALYCGRLGDEYAAKKKSAPAAQPARARTSKSSSRSTTTSTATAPMRLLTQPRVNEPKSAKEKPFPYRLSNTARSVGQLLRDDHAILLENALIDSAIGAPLPIPEHLRATGDPGTYIVQARGKLDENFRAALQAVGAGIVAYVPNNAYLVRVGAAGAQRLAALPQTQTVLPYEPYYKLKSDLLRLAVKRVPLAEGGRLNVAVFADARDATVEAFRKLGAEIVGEERSPFGPVLTVRPDVGGLITLARLPGVQLIEPYAEREAANDLSRVRMQVSPDTVGINNNYLGLTGSNVFVAVNDTGVDPTHPDLTGRMIGDPADPLSLVDNNGHGTHVAGIIAGNGAQSATVSNASGSVVGADFRGKAPAARIFSQRVNMPNRPFTVSGSPAVSDAYLQENAARTNALISNNSWVYSASSAYDLHAASYDAAVRDALPLVQGSQPLLCVFAAGNGGNGNDRGSQGESGSIRSPATAKNVLTVGALEQFRNITNSWSEIITNVNGTNITVVTNEVVMFASVTDSDDQVANFSSRGNVGIGIEGEFGRFKPDVVAPGVFVVSTRSSTWNAEEYYYVNPTNYTVRTFTDLYLEAGDIFSNSIFLAGNTVGLTVWVTPNENSPVPFPDLPIFAQAGTWPTAGNLLGTNLVSFPLTLPASVDMDWFYTVANVTGQPVSFDLTTIRTWLNTDPNATNWLQVLRDLNDGLGPYYRYESGTSMSAAQASGVLALMQEFFEQRLGRTNSPALMKALLINGARSLDNYDLQVGSLINFQGWGLINLTNSLPSLVVSNLIAFDQNPTNALATGQSQSHRIQVNAGDRARTLRMTLVWTDPPGNPAVGVKLVNDLDLVVTNLDTGDVYFGNNISFGSDYNQVWDTNSPPVNDVLNNVENVYLPPLLGTNYAITVIANRVNVNAVTAHTNDVVQDYALVISLGDGPVGGSFSPVEDPLQSPNVVHVRYVTNLTSGGFLLSDRVGANTPLLGLTNGMTNQWSFYVFTNTTADVTNLVFFTFQARNLSLPRMGVREDTVGNATRAEADIDLYVTTDSDLTNLTPIVIGQCAANNRPVYASSRSRGGTELILITNPPAGQAYYIGVKSEDQMAAEYYFGVLTNASTSPCYPNVAGPVLIPDGTADDPGVTNLIYVFFPDPGCPFERIRRVVVTNIMTHEEFGDLQGELSYNKKFAVLNNHTFPDGQFDGTFPFIYEDNGEGDIVGSRPTDGPGSLLNFLGDSPYGLWLLTMADNFTPHTGSVDRATLKLESEVANGGTFEVPPNKLFFVGSIDVPAGATNLTISITNITVPAGNQGPVELRVRLGKRPTLTADDYRMTINPPSGSLSIKDSDLPPLQAGRYYVSVYNPNAIAQMLIWAWALGVDISGLIPIQFTTNGPLPLTDDAVTYSSLFVTNDQRILTVDVGLQVDHPRVSDLVFHLISPSGTRFLLMENRGGTNSSGASTNQLVNSVTTMETDFETALPGSYTPGSTVENWLVTNNQVTVVQSVPADTGIQSLALRSGGIARDFPTKPGANYTLTSAVRRVPTLDGIISWWPGENSTVDVVAGNAGTWAGFGNVNTYGPGFVGQAFVFDGTHRDRVDLGNPTNLQVQNLTVEAWIKRSNPTEISFDDNSQDGGQAGEGGFILGYGRQGWGLAVMNDGRLVLTETDVGGVYSTGLVSDTSWHHVAVTKAGATAIFYIDGALASAPLAFPFTFTFSTNVSIGSRGDARGGTFYGAVDEPAVFNRDLTASEIQAIYAAGAAGKCGMTFPPTNCLSYTGQVSVGGISNIVSALSTNWVMTTNLSFVATQTNTLVQFDSAGGNSGLLLDTIALTGTLVVTQGFYLTFTENTNLTTTPIKFAPPSFGSPGQSSNLFISGFEPAAAGDYIITSPTFDGWTSQTTNPVTVIDDVLLANTGTKSLALRGGQIQRTLSTTAGRNHVLNFAYRKSPTLDGIVSWWPLDVAANDIVDGNSVPLCCGPVLFVPGEVNQAMHFDGIDDKLTVPAATNLNVGLGTGFAVEAWINPTSVNLERPIVEWNSVTGGNPWPYGVHLWISTGGGFGTGPGCLYANLVDTSGAFHPITSAPGLITANTFQHVGLTYDKTSGVAKLYLNGAIVAQQNLGVFTPQTSYNLYLGHRPGGVAVAYYWAGLLDEITLYNRALTGAEMQAIYDAGAAGKCGMAIAPALCPSFSAQVFVPGIATNIFTGSSTNWQTNSLAFTAAASGTPLVLGTTNGLSHVLLDTFTLTENVGSIYFLPEETLAALTGENAYGEWRLEILDNRTGATNLVNLASWQLSFVFENSTPVASVLDMGIAQTNTVPPGQIAYYIVNVPAWAQFATNTLLFASAPLNLWFNQSTPPFGTGVGDYLLLGSATSGSNTLSVTTTPPLLPGQRYYLGVQNTNSIAVTYALRVDFDITGLTNAVPLTSALDTNDLVRYFYFDVSSNAYAATFQLLKLSGSADLVVRKGLPLPTLFSSDYGSFNAGNLDENIYVLTNSAPVPLSSGHWYLGVFKRVTGTVDYTILAKELVPPQPTIIDLTNNVPFDYSAGPGAALTTFFRATVTNVHQAMRYELYNLSGDGDLTLQFNAPPFAPPFLMTSEQPDLKPELISLQTNSALTNLSGAWYLGVPNHETNLINFTILACLPAFPDAEGAGSIALGSRGSTDVYHVVTLNDSGPGSLRDAVSSTNRTIVFDVSGTITLLSPLVITNSRLTLAGQTAPGDGITVRGQMTSVENTRDVIIRYLRFRPGDLDCPTNQADAFRLDHVSDVIVDHITATWGLDENLSTTDSTNVTVQWSVIADSLSTATGGCRTNHGYGSLLRYGYGTLSLHHNLYANNDSANPRLGDNLSLDFINNVIYNWGTNAGYSADDSLDNPNGFTNRLNYVGNYLIAGTNSLLRNIAFRGGTTNTWIFQADNFIDDNTNGILDGANTQSGMFTNLYTSHALAFSLPPVSVDPAFIAYERVLAFAGAALDKRDAADRGIVGHVRTNSGLIIGSQSQAGGWPPLNSIPLPVDTDQDGIPDYWEITLGEDVNVASNNQDRDRDGYTDLEEYVNWLAVPHGLTVVNTPVDVDLYLLAGNTGNLTFSLGNAVNGTVTLTNSLATFTPSNNISGYASFDFLITNTNTAATFGPVTVSVMVSGVSILTPPPIVTLTNLISYTTTNFAGTNSVDYYRYNVSTNACAVKFEVLNPSGDVTLVARRGFPLPSLASFDYLSTNPGSNNEVIVVTTNSVPVPLTPGDWYLAVTNISGTNVSYAIVATEATTCLPPIITLTNGIPYFNTNSGAGSPNDYYLYRVTTNACEVKFEVLNPSDDVTLVARRSLPLPSLANYDYLSTNPGSNNEVIVVTTNSVPVPLTPGDWYLAVTNISGTNVSYAIVATEATTCLPPIITLTNGIPYFNTNSGAGSPNDYYLYVVSTNAARAQFEINGPTADLTLVARKGLPLPDLGTFDYLSANSGTTDELIVVLTNTAPVPLTPGDWYLSAVNLSGGPASYAIMATEWSLTGLPITVTSSFVTSNSFCFTWTSLPGVHYHVQGLPNLNSTNWLALPPAVTATDYFTTWCIGLPSPFHFFRVVEGLALNFYVAPPAITSITRTNNVVLIGWTGPTNVQYQVQWSPTLVPSTWNSFTNLITSTNGLFSFLDDGLQTGGLGATRYYRLVQLP